MVDDGTASFKVFLAYKGAFGIDDGELFRTLELARRLGVIVTAHCENAELVAAAAAAVCWPRAKPGPSGMSHRVPPAVEGRRRTSSGDIRRTDRRSTSTSCILHAKRRWRGTLPRERGVALWVETVIPYLVLDRTYAERPEFEGAKYVMSPPLRELRHQQALWNALAAGEIDTVATDHAPFDFRVQKEMGRGDFTKIPNGIPSVQDRVHLLYTHGVATGRIDLQRFVDVASTKAAKLFGLFPRKGTIQPGADADLVIFDPEYRGTISAATQLMNVDYSAFEGWPIQGRAETVTVRGRVQVRDGRFVGAGNRRTDAQT